MIYKCTGPTCEQNQASINAYIDDLFVTALHIGEFIDWKKRGVGFRPTQTFRDVVE